jgi:aspartate aminotransferase
VHSSAAAVERLPHGLRALETPGEGGQRPATSMELADLILEEAKVAIVPGEAFGAPGYARLSYALGDDDLVEGVTRIAKLLAESRPG